MGQTSARRKGLGMNDCQYYTVISIDLINKSRKPIESNVWANSSKAAFNFEKSYFGEPYFRVLRAFPKNSNLQDDES